MSRALVAADVRLLPAPFHTVEGIVRRQRQVEDDDRGSGIDAWLVLPPLLAVPFSAKIGAAAAQLAAASTMWVPRGRSAPVP